MAVKGVSKKKVEQTVWSNAAWKVVEGRLSPGPGRPPKQSHLFRFVAEKLPFECLPKIQRHLSKTKVIEGVYFAHDSMGVARYGGRGQIFTRLAAHKKKYPMQLQYFSFYVIASKTHEREIETAILRAAGPQMTLNTRKISDGIEAGDIQDYEPGTQFFERQRPRGKKPRVQKRRKL